MNSDVYLLLTSTMAALAAVIAAAGTVAKHWDGIRDRASGVVRLLCCRWRKSGVIWMVFRWGDDYVGRVHVPHSTLIKLWKVDDGTFFSYSIKPCESLQEAKKRVGRSAKLWVCRQKWGLRYIEHRQTRKSIYLEGMVVMMNGERPVVSLPDSSGNHLPGREIREPLAWGIL